MPMSSLRLVDYNEVREVIERLRVNVPSSITESERMLQERDRILAEAEAEAEHMMEEARRRAADILSDDALVSSARQEAERVMTNAQITAKRRQDEADRYAARVLEELAEKLSVIGKQVDNGLTLLRQNMGLDSADEP